MKKTILKGEVVEIDKIEPERMPFAVGDTVYPIWPAYEPDKRFRCVERHPSFDGFRCLNRDGSLRPRFFEDPAHFRKAP